LLLCGGEAGGQQQRGDARGDAGAQPVIVPIDQIAFTSARN
jgi:hypothetical protein